jgi:mxaJ protein
MSALGRHVVAAVLLLGLVGASGTAADATALRVCSDPNNLPYSNRAGAGFEDAIARLVASELELPLEHHFWAQRRGFVRNTLKAGKCDVIMGVPRELDSARTTTAYYRSTYVFVTRAELAPPLRTFDDARLRRLKVGVPVIGDDYANPPPVHALSRRGIVDNVVGFSVFGDYRQDSPPLELVRAVERGDIDVAIAWGPVAGYVARHSRKPLRLQTVAPARDGPHPFVFSIAMAVRPDDEELARKLDAVIAKNRKRIEGILHDYGVPLL